ncbi:MAG: ABC transporter substrate-binding protein [Desulfobacterium sp.]|nr:ABC transporter substrate-binding protein [Desulfobacterium sp.]
MGQKPVFKIGVLGWMAPFYKGFSDLEGEFDTFFLKKVFLGSWNRVFERLCDRLIDGAFIPVPAAIDLVRSGVDIRLFFTLSGTEAFFVKSRGAGVRRMSQFKGKTILVPHELSIYTLLIHRFMASAGLCLGQNRSSEVFFEAMSVPLMGEALAYDHEGHIGGFIAPEPFCTGAVKAGDGSLVCSAEKLWPGYTSGVFVLDGALADSCFDSAYGLVTLLMRALGSPEGAESGMEGDEKTDFLIDTRAIRQVEKYMQDEFGQVPGGKGILGAVQGEFAMGSGAGN